jgi:predicted negative regulator of RcsB-dependent stress response
VSDRITRKDLRTDKFAVAVEHNVEYVAEHRAQVIRYALIGLAVLLLGAAIYFYRGHQRDVRQEKLADAIHIQETNVQPGVQPGPLSFPTDEAKRAAATKAFSALSTEFSGSREGLVAQYYLASIAADAGKLDEARKRYQSVADSGDKDYASLARLSLAGVDFSENRNADGEKRLRDLMANPTVLVSKEQAIISLAHHYATTNPAEARKLLEPLTTTPSSASQAAVQLLGDMQAQ